MKTKSTLLFAIAGLFLVQLFSSCNTSFDISKRRYNKGYFIDVSSNDVRKTEARTPAKAVPATIEKIKAAAEAQGINSVEVANVLENNKESIATLTASADKIIAKASNPRVARKINKALATYAMIEKQTDQDAAASVTQASSDTKDMKKANTTHGGGKSQLIALLLVILVGGLGIHRFYLGYTWQGVVQLLTLGGCGVWALIDLIRIITGDLKPKDGDYDTKL
jgi:TM2 domain-containing membrane protein YozV